MVKKKPLKSIRQDIPVARNEANYNNIMAEIEQLIKAGKTTLRNKDLTLYSNRAKAATAYEQSVYTTPPIQQ